MWGTPRAVASAGTEKVHRASNYRAIAIREGSPHSLEHSAQLATRIRGRRGKLRVPVRSGGISFRTMAARRAYTQSATERYPRYPLRRVPMLAKKARPGVVPRRA